MPFEIVERLGIGIARVKYPGIGETGVRNLLSDGSLGFDEIKSAVQDGERGPPAVEVPNPAGFGSSYYDLRDGKFISQTEYETRRLPENGGPPTITYYRHSLICQGEYDPDRPSDPTVEYEIDIWYYTATPEQESGARDYLDALMDSALIMIRQQMPFVECEQRKYEVNRRVSSQPPAPEFWDPEGRLEAKGSRYIILFSLSGDKTEAGSWTATGIRPI